MKRVGFIINSRVPEIASLRKGMLPHAMVTGWDDGASPMSFMRFHWIANALKGRICYELYRPWRRYDVVVFLKSMGPHCLRLVRKLKASGVRVVFEANVDYYTRYDGSAVLDAMAPTDCQQADAIAITEIADMVIASSRHLADVCRSVNPRSEWIPDNVNLALAPAHRSSGETNAVLNVWWSGMASKAFELLIAQEAFREYGRRIHLHLVTNDFEVARRTWPADIRDSMDRLLKAVLHTIHPFRDIASLLANYAGGGVIVSPRSLDTPYNHSHTEWKITLGMAVGLPAIASPVPSYVDVRDRARDGAVTICDSNEEWLCAFDWATGRSLQHASTAAAEVVREHYDTVVIADRHARLIEALS